MAETESSKSASDPVASRPAKDISAEPPLGPSMAHRRIKGGPLTSPVWWVLLVVRLAVTLFLPAFFAKGESDAGQDQITRTMVFEDQTAGRMSFDKELGPMVSAVPAMITTALPYALWQASGLLPVAPGSQEEMIMAMIVPRVWNFFLTMIIDILIVRSFDFLGGQGAKPALMCWSTMWTTMVILSRPSAHTLEAISVALIFYACFGTGASWMLLYVTAAVATVIGMHVRVPFLLFGVLMLIHLHSLSAKPYFNVMQNLRGLVVGLVVFFALLGCCSLVDSVYYGYMDIMLDGKVLTPELFSFYKLGEMSLRGKFTIVPLNVLMRLKEFSKLRAEYTPALGQIFGTTPVILGMLTVVLLQDTYTGTKKTIKELRTEFKNVNSGQGIGGSSSGKKKRKKKVPQAAKDREDDELAFQDIVQTSFLLAIIIDVAFTQDEAGLVTLLPITVPASIMLGDRVSGSMKNWILEIGHLLYGLFGIIVLGTCINGGASWLASEVSAVPTSVVPAGSQIVFYNTAAPPLSLLGRNPLGIQLREFNASSEKLLETLENNAGESENVFVLSPATQIFEDTSSLEIVRTVRGHLSGESPPSNPDEVITKNSATLYQFHTQPSKYADMDDYEDDDVPLSDDDRDEL